MAMKKKTKAILMWILGIVAAFFIWKNFFQKDKMGGRMTLDGTALGGSNVVYNGKKIVGWIKPGTLRVVNGYWQGVAGDMKTQASYQETGWVTVA